MLGSLPSYKSLITTVYMVCVCMCATYVPVYAYLCQCFLEIGSVPQMCVSMGTKMLYAVLILLFWATVFISKMRIIQNITNKLGKNIKEVISGKELIPGLVTSKCTRTVSYC